MESLIQFGKPYHKDDGIPSLAWSGSVLSEWRSPEHPRILAISGKPCADTRPRVSLRFKDKNKPIFQSEWARNAYIHVYDQKSTEKQSLRKQLRLRGIDTVEPASGPGLLFCSFSFAIPKSTSKKKAEQMVLSNHGIKPDIDNLSKFYMDVLQERVIPSDAGISALFAVKFYSRIPGVMICYFPEVTASVMNQVFTYSKLFKGYTLGVQATEGSRQGVFELV